MKKAHSLLLFLSLGGCAVTGGVDFTKVDMNTRFDAKPAQRIAVEVQDRRPYVINGQERPNFIGRYFGTYGVQFKTEHGNPLAEDLSVLITNSLVEQGLKAAQARKIAIYDIMLRFTLQEWATARVGDGTGYFYDVGLTVLDRDGNIISQRNVSNICTYDFERGLELDQAGVDPWLETSANVLETLLSDAAATPICVELMKPVPESRIAGSPLPHRARVIFVRPPRQTRRLQLFTAPVLEIGSGKVDLVGFLSVGRKVSYLSEPGEKLFMVIGENTDLMRAYLEGGKTYYVKLSNHIGWLKDYFYLEPVSRARAPYEGVKGKQRLITLVENTEVSRRWLQSNLDSVADKKADALENWNRMSEEEKEKHTLWAHDGH